MEYNVSFRSAYIFKEPVFLLYFLYIYLYLILNFKCLNLNQIVTLKENRVIKYLYITRSLLASIILLNYIIPCHFRNADINNKPILITSKSLRNVISHKNSSLCLRRE